jgi:hypothetical protein
MSGCSDIMYRSAYNMPDLGPESTILCEMVHIYRATVALRRRRLPALPYLLLTRVSGEQIELSAAFIVALSDFRLAPTLAWIASK